VQKEQLPLEVGLAVLDPDDSLPFAQPAIAGTAKLLVGPKALSRLAHDHADLATRHTLRETLGAAPAHSIFVFCGHATTSDDESPAAAALVLADGQQLAARELLAPMPKSHEYALPARTLLSACATAGAHTREWLGLGPACLWAGSSAVIVTTWPTLDSAGTARMDERLIEALQSSWDVATALRDIQLQQLHAWGASVAPKHPTKADPVQLLEDVHAPYLWAPYICLELHPS
jgi:CHAT domain-containing protein